jgi:hypothetical protein
MAEHCTPPRCRRQSDHGEQGQGRPPPLLPAKSVEAMMTNHIPADVKARETSETEGQIDLPPSNSAPLPQRERADRHFRRLTESDLQPFPLAIDIHRFTCSNFGRNSAERVLRRLPPAVFV